MLRSPVVKTKAWPRPIAEVRHWLARWAWGGKRREGRIKQIGSFSPTAKLSPTPSALFKEGITVEWHRATQINIALVGEALAPSCILRILLHSYQPQAAQSRGQEEIWLWNILKSHHSELVNDFLTKWYPPREQFRCASAGCVRGPRRSCKQFRAPIWHFLLASLLWAWLLHVGHCRLLLAKHFTLAVFFS